MEFKEITAAVNKVADIAQAEEAPDSKWTEMIKRSLGALAERDGYEVRTTTSDKRYAGEWLYDFTALETDSEGNILSIALALESEGNTSFEEISYDFDKLIQAKAKQKVMIFQQRKKSDVISIFERLEARANAFKKTGTKEPYLFLGLFWDEGWFVDQSVEI